MKRWTILGQNQSSRPSALFETMLCNWVKVLSLLGSLYVKSRDFKTLGSSCCCITFILAKWFQFKTHLCISPTNKQIPTNAHHHVHLRFFEGFPKIMTMLVSWSTLKEEKGLPAIALQPAFTVQPMVICIIVLSATTMSMWKTSNLVGGVATGYAQDAWSIARDASEMMYFGAIIVSSINMRTNALKQTKSATCIVRYASRHTRACIKQASLARSAGCSQWNAVGSVGIATNAAMVSVAELHILQGSTRRLSKWSQSFQ